MQTAIITGANKGIGLACVHRFLEEGFRVIGTGRSEFSLDKPNFEYHRFDVSNLNQVQSFYENLNNLESVEVLVNNAGLGHAGYINDISFEQWHEMFNINVNGLFYMTKMLMPTLIKNQKGHVFNISSIAGQEGIEGMSGYCATKFAVKGFSRSLYKEVRKFGVKVTTIYPGSVNTNFFDEIDAITANDSMMRAKDVAETIYNAYNTFGNFHLTDIEMRPLQPKK